MPSSGCAICSETYRAANETLQRELMTAMSSATEPAIVMPIPSNGPPAPRVFESDNAMKKEYDFSKARRGVVVPQTGKTRITIYIDDDVLEAFRERADAAGSGYQTMMNQALREYLGKSARPVDEKTLRRVLKEVLASE